MHRADKAEVRPAEHRHEMRSGEGEHEVIAHVLHALGHHLDQVAVRPDLAGRAAIGPAGQQEQQEEGGDEAAVKRRKLRMDRTISRRDRLARGFVDQRRARGEDHQQPERDHEQRGIAGMPQPLGRQRAAFVGGIGAHVVGLRAGGRAAFPRAEPRFDNLVGDIPDDRQVHEGHHADEEPVARDIGSPQRVERARAYRFLGDPEQQRIELAGRDIGRETARHAGKCGGDPSQRMASSGGEKDAGERDQHNIARIGGMVAEHCDQRNHRGEQ